MSLPYMPLFVDDYEADTAHLSLIEDGIYNRLLRLCWRSPRCQIPNDHEWIARKIRASTKAEREAMANILAEFFTIRRGGIFSKRLSAEHARISASISRRKEAGKKGGGAKSLKTNKSKPSNATALPKHPEPEPYPKEKATAFSGAGARKPNGFVRVRKTTDAIEDFIEELGDDERRIGIGSEGNGSDVPMLSSIRAG